jgi:ABC-type nickel/cobalt efflux system permease component RcnA
VLGLDDQIASLSDGRGLVVALVVALLLGLRHATDPDHLTAVATLVMSEQRRVGRRAGLMGLAWGAGHASTLLAFGMPFVLFGSYLPEAVERAAEVAIGLVIVALASRLLLRWHRGYFHFHPHSHGYVRHAHPHMHEHAAEYGHPERHEHSHSPGRTPAAAYGIGLIHGLGGSAGVGVLLIGAMSSRAGAVAALAIFAVATAVSMALVSTGFGLAVGSGRLARRSTALAPALGALSLAFGAWYALAAI